MLEHWLYKINEALIQINYYAFIASFIWGICSVIFSPCHLASIPLIIGYIGGFTNEKKMKYAFKYSLLFVIGLFISITVIGIITSLIGRIMGDVGKLWNYIIGIFLIIVALHLLDIITIKIPVLHKIQTKRKGGIGAFLLGTTYGIVSGPCTFGFIAPMLAMIAIQKTMMRGIILIIIFSVGHCIPILIGGTTTSFVKNITTSDTLQNSGIYFKKASGLLFILVGIYILVNNGLSG